MLKIFEQIAQGKFRFKIRLRVQDPNYLQNMESVNDFIVRYFNAFFNEMGVFGEYHAVQEYTNRAKFIELCDKKINDLSRFYLICKSLVYYREIKLFTKIKLEYFNYHKNIIGMADYLSVIYQNMKTGFMPESDITKALQVTLKNSINLNEQNEEISSTTAEIERYMKIELLNENINREHIKAEVLGGRLFLKSKNIEFVIKMAGDIGNSYWQLVSVNTNSTAADSVLYQTFCDLKQSLIRKIVEFVVFYDNKVKSHETFNKLKNTQGHFKNFTGEYNSMLYNGIIDEKNIFRLYKVTNNKRIEVDDLPDSK